MAAANPVQLEMVPFRGGWRWIGDPEVREALEALDSHRRGRGEASGFFSQAYAEAFGKLQEELERRARSGWGDYRYRGGRRGR